MSQTNPNLAGQIALQEGYVTAGQLEECLKIQESTAPARSIGEILLEKNYLTREQLASVVELQRAKFEALTADPERGGLFGQIALRLRYVTEPQLYECLREQQALARGASSLQLGQILLKRSYLKIDQFLEVLRRQNKQLVRCPVCQAPYDSPKDSRKGRFACSRCGTVVQIPGAAS
jgi:hypothetical protein